MNTFRPRQNARHFPDILKCIIFNKIVWISMKISLKYALTVLINNIPVLVQIMVWRRPGDNPFSEPMMVTLLTRICVTQWMKMPLLIAKFCPSKVNTHVCCIGVIAWYWRFIWSCIYACRDSVPGLWGYRTHRSRDSCMIVSWLWHPSSMWIGWAV